jgi:hypothetical protein
VRVVTPDGQDLAGESAELRARIAASLGEPVELMHLKHGIHDEAPLSLIAVATLQRLSQESGVPFDVRRFRPNLLIETTDERPLVEDGWLGRSSSAAAETGQRPDRRDPARPPLFHGEPDPTPEKTDPLLGIAVAEPGRPCMAAWGGHDPRRRSLGALT